MILHIKNIKRISAMILLGIFMAAGTGCAFIPKEEEVLAPPIKEPEKVVFDTLEVKLSSIESSIECTGAYVSVYQQDVYYSTRGGRIKEINIEEGDRVKAGDVLVEIDTGTLEQDIRFQEIGLERARIQYDKLKSQPGMVSEYDLRLAELSVEENTLRLQNMRDQLEDAKLRAPIDGQVTYYAGLRVGENVNTFQVVAVIADPDRLQIQYSGERVPDFKLGAEVEITHGVAKLKGAVVATPDEMPADANPNKRKSILIDVEEIPEDAKMGATVTIKLVLSRKDNVIVIPKGLINTFAGRTFVNVLKDGIREERDVEIGISTATEVEIRKGLTAGELIIRQ